MPRRRSAPAPLRSPAAVLGSLALALVASAAPACGGDAAVPDERATATYERALAELREGDRRTALADLKQVVERAPEWPEGWRTLGQVAALTMDHATCMEAQRFLLDRDPGDAAAAAALTEAGLAAGDPDAAAEGLARLDASEPAAARTRLLHARSSLELGDMEAARRWAELALEVDPRDAQAAYVQAVALEDLGREDEAIAGYRRVLKLDPGHLGARDSLATMLAASGLEEAAAPHRELHTKLSWALARQYQHRPANQRKEEFGELVELLPEWPRGWVELARAERDLGDTAGAQRTLDECLARHASPEAHELMAEILDSLGKPKAAARHADAARQLRRP